VPHEAKRSLSLESTVYSPTIINTPSTVTPNIKPTIFTTKHEPPEYSPNVKDVASQSIKGQTSSFPLIPSPITQTLQTHIDDLLSSLAYNQQTAEISLQETLDDFKVELQIEKEKAIEEVEEYGQEVLENVKSQMEDLAGGYLVGFEDALQKMEGGNILPAATVTATATSPSPIKDTLATPASAATKIFLHDFKHLCLADKVKVLERLASQNIAEIFLTVDTELREAWVASWIA
jgi:hypothetical protein